jgi:glycosyltransferase involved in cell wall biosynthesis
MEEGLNFVQRSIEHAGAESAERTGTYPLRLLFHYSVLQRGGAEMSLLRLMNKLAKHGHDVHLVLTCPGGALESEVDSRIHVTHLRGVRTWEPVLGGRLIGAAYQILRWLVGKLQECFRRRRFSGVTFDGVFIGLTGLSPAFACKHLQARKRFVFVRSDPAHADRKGRWARDIRRWNAHLDGYVCVSHYVQRAMERQFPEVAEKLVTIYNVLDPGEMREKAKGASPFAVADVPNVVSVCRLQEASKALLRMVEVHRRLLEAGVVHVWHVLGDGPDGGQLIQAIRNAGLESSFLVHGAIANPFPWYRHADLVAVLSRYEGLCGAVNEARVLERPVIATRFSGIEEQIESGVSGLIVEQDTDAIFEGMALLLRDAALRARLAAGGYSPELMDDDAKLGRLLSLVGGEPMATVRLSA